MEELSIDGDVPLFAKRKIVILVPCTDHLIVVVLTVVSVWVMVSIFSLLCSCLSPEAWNELDAQWY
jgi:hypothetical protein